MDTNARCPQQLYVERFHGQRQAKRSTPESCIWCEQPTWVPPSVQYQSVMHIIVWLYYYCSNYCGVETAIRVSTHYINPSILHEQKQHIRLITRRRPRSNFIKVPWAQRKQAVHHCSFGCISANHRASKASTVSAISASLSCPANLKTQNQLKLEGLFGSSRVAAHDHPIHHDTGPGRTSSWSLIIIFR